MKELVNTRSSHVTCCVVVCVPLRSFTTGIEKTGLERVQDFVLRFSQFPTYRISVILIHVQKRREKLNTTDTREQEEEDIIS